MTSFNLITEPWIPVLLRGNPEPREVSLREALARAPDIAALTDPSPLVTVALHRLLLAVCHRIYGPTGPGQWRRLWDAGMCDAETLDHYLGNWRHRFDLFDEERPFYQTPGLPESVATSVSKLGHEFAAGNNPILFDHSIDATPPALTPAEAGRLVVSHQAFAIGGLITRLPGDPPSAESAHLVKAAVHVVTGDNLFETLLLNMVPIDPDPGSAWNLDPARNVPAWEQAPPSAVARTPGGLIDLLTWQPRRILLFPDPDGTVRKAAVMAGLKFPPGSEIDKFETMVAYTKRDVAKNQYPWFPVGFKPEQALWRDSAALLDVAAEGHARAATLRWLSELKQAGHLEEEREFGLSLLGLSSDRAKVFLWREESLPLPAAYINHRELVAELTGALAAATEAGKRLRLSMFSIAGETLGPGGSADRDRTAALVDSLAPERVYWPALDEPFRRFIRDLAAGYAIDGGEAAERQWAGEIEAAATIAFEVAASAIETTGRGYRAAAMGRGRFRAALAHALGSLLPETSEEVTT